MPILFKEIEQAYFHDRIPPGLEASYPQYAQYLKTTSSNIDFWKGYLEGVQPCSFPILVSQTHILSEWETTSIDLNIPCKRLKALANEYSIDISAILTVAWGLLLRNYTGKDSVCFGHRIAGRCFPVENLRNTVGSFSTVLASKLEIRDKEFVTQLLLNAEKDRIKTLNHQNVPLSRVEHELQIRGGRLFNTYLSFGYECISHETSTSLRCQHIRTEQVSEYDVGVDVYFHDGNMTVDVGHRILNSDQAITIACAFGRAIEAILDSPTSIVQEVDLFSMRDHEQILAWNSMPQADIPKGHVHDLVAHQASLNPEIQAICAWDGDLSYGDLHDLSMVLAKHILASGLKRQMPVPVVMDKSRWAVVAMLAVLYAGAILVPIDVEIPSIIPWSVQEVSADFVLCSASARKHVNGLGANVIVVDENAVLAMSAQAVDMNLLHHEPYEIACILFSAGSLGTFKGISYSHRSLAAACVGQGSTLLINPSSRVMQLSSYNVDIALSEIFTTLVNGGCVCIPSASERITDFSEAAMRMHVNWTYLTPTLSRKLDPENLPDLSIVCIRAQHLDDDIYAPWIGKAKVLMAYGSPEAGPLALSVTEVADPKASQCFGNPFYGNFWIVSPEDSNRLMPVGALGELIIGGPTLATSLDIHEPDIKTWIKEGVVCPMSLLEKSESRLLKTGHYARYLEDGRIEFASEDGGEVEIDGKIFRLSVVELKLRQCLGRGIDVVVEMIAFDDPNSDPILAAFVDFGENALRRDESLSNLNRTTKERLYLFKKIGNMALRETLPSYMMPSAYIPVKRMPLTPTLEVNRIELQRMIAGSPRKQLLEIAEVSNPQELQDLSFKPLPLTEVEHRMRVIWAQVLGVEEDTITARDGFLTLGGDIVLAHELIRECKQCGVDISIIDVLRNTPLAEICRGGVTLEIYPTAIQGVFEPTQSNHSNSPISKAIASRLGLAGSLVEDATEASSLQAMFIESGMLQTRATVDYLEINITGSLDWHKLQDACFMLTNTHPILRTSFASHSRQLYQTVYRSHRPGFLRYQCQSWRLSNLIAKLIKREQAQLVDFSQPVTKFFYFDAGKSSVLIMRLSKAQYDELSLPVLIRDLTQFYNHSDRPGRRPGFCEVVRASHRAYTNDTYEYWRTLLEGAAVTQIISQPSPTKINLNHTTLHRKIPNRSLHSLGISFETILKGAWSVVLSNLSATNDVVFGQLVDGRNLSLPNKQSISDVIGPLGNILPVRTRLPDIPIASYEYFRCIQSQHVASMSQNMQFSDIIQKATSWPSWTRFSTVIYHKNQSKDDGMIEFAVGGATCKLNCIEMNHAPSDIFVKSYISGSANVDISLTFSEKIALSFADEVLGMLCSVISLLTSTFVTEPLYLKGLGNNRSTLRIPLQAPRREPSIPQTVESVEPDLARAVHTIISSAWDTILEAYSLKFPDIRSVPFYEIWGSLIPASELAKYYTDNIPSDLGVERATFTEEEIINHPTMMQQYELIIAKHRTLCSRRNRNTMLVRTQSVWGRSIRRLPRVSVAPSASAPRSNHRPMGSSTSMESMTTGSSLSDDDELKDRHHQLPPLIEKETGEVIRDNYGWLALAKENIRRELEASKMELELVRDLLSELEVGSKITRSNCGARDEVFLMRACQEYSGSRSCMLEERLRQINLWLSDVRIGRDVPYRVPDEWSMVDAEWRRWLSEQVAPRDRDSVSDRPVVMSHQSDAVKLWGPLIPILTAYIE
ncbi:Nonribosomal peptide synthetase 12 [Daldinia childiae]|uniref:Nonribosomal peptide synthetase 12 n=1 Tax=Daldinia childiae TaxID=326645 RepID=UPI0014466197|nr:Nonribosomal peptide synthetase 12 [Daldinia childiae]KAF3071249.1 Nonribosomal peptide synthetase 12 [Daldinia childiae]